MDNQSIQASHRKMESSIDKTVAALWENIDFACEMRRSDLVFSLADILFHIKKALRPGISGEAVMRVDFKGKTAEEIRELISSAAQEMLEPESSQST